MMAKPGFWTAIRLRTGSYQDFKRYPTRERALCQIDLLLKDDVVEVVLLQEVGVYRNLGVEREIEEAKK